jgi:hypothetical protein
MLRGDSAAVASHTHSTRHILQSNRGKDSSRYLGLDFLTKEGNMTGNFQRGLSNDRNTAMDEAMILSVEADVAPDTLRVSLQWQGNHDISDFDLQRFGKVLRIQDETENTGWAIIERRFHARIAHTLPGWAIHESMRPLTAGDTIPLRRDIE